MALDPASVNVVIYHADCTDGFGAAYSAWKQLGNRAEYYPCKHGTPPPDVKGKNVVILDFSYGNELTKKMIEDANNLLIIDHHKSAMVELHDVSNTYFDMTKSGAMLAWEFFHPGKEPPKFIKYIQDRDLWKWELDYSKEFSAAFDMVPFEFVLNSQTPYVSCSPLLFVIQVEVFLYSIPDYSSCQLLQMSL